MPIHRLTINDNSLQSGSGQNKVQRIDSSAESFPRCASKRSRPQNTVAHLNESHGSISSSSDCPSLAVWPGSCRDYRRRLSVIRMIPDILSSRIRLSYSIVATLSSSVCASTNRQCHVPARLSLPSAILLQRVVIQSPRVGEHDIDFSDNLTARRSSKATCSRFRLLIFLLAWRRFLDLS